MIEKKKTFLLLLLATFCLPSLHAQSDYMPGGGGVSAGGSVFITYGQPVCLYGTDAAGAYYNGQGVQQPYCQSQLDTIRAEVCQHQPFSWGDILMPPDSTSIAGQRILKHIYHIGEGCDSTVVLILNIHAASNESIAVNACDTFSWHDSIFLNTTTYTHYATSQAGCDSTTTLHLTIRHSSSSQIEIQAVKQYQWHGVTYIESGIYPEILHAANADGCDSIVFLNLALLRHAPIPVIYCYAQRVLMVDHYPWGEDSLYVDYAAYRWYHNGELMPMNNRDVLFDYRHNAYYNLDGCYYVEVSTDKSNQYWVRSNEICIAKEEDSPAPTLTVYPNPSTSGSSIVAKIEDAPQGSTLMIYDSYGRIVSTLKEPVPLQTLPGVLHTGHYTVSLRTPQGETINQKIIVR